MSQLHLLSKELQEQIKAEVKGFDRVVWCVAPEVSFRTYASGFGIWLFAIPWTAISVFAFSGTIIGLFSVDTLLSWQTALAIFMVLFLLPFVLIGLWLLYMPIYGIKVGKNSAYVITEKRAIVIFKERSGFKIRSFNPRDIIETKKKIRADGSGDLIFVCNRYLDSDGDLRDKTIGFEALPDVHAADKEIQKLLERSKGYSQPS